MAQAKPKFRNAYSDQRRRQKYFTDQVTRTEQSHKDDCDINQIVAKYQKTGAIEHRNQHEPQYGFATSTDLQTAIETVETAQEMFNDLPSSIRDKFDHNPGRFLDFVQNPANGEEMIELGLATRRPSSEPPAASTAAKTEPPAGGEPA